MTLHKYNLLLAIAALLVLCPGLSGAATITVHSDRNPVVLQESFQLLFEAVGKVDGDPDFTPLEKDFQVLSTSTSSSVSIVNTEITRTRQWRLNLLPLKTGELTVPAISFGKDKSPPTLLTVSQDGAGSTGRDAPDIFIEVEAAPASAYVQAELIYTIKLFRAIATSNETLSEPELEQGSAIIELLDADRTYDVFDQGRRYTVFERSYGIYPQVSGTLSILPVRFRGQTPAVPSFRLDPFGAGTRTVVRQSEPVRLEIMPVPASYRGGHWLPAADVRISEEWSKNPLELLPNEPATRTLTLTAQGLTASQLPALQELFPADFKQYPDEPELENRKNAGGVTALRQQKSAVIPALAGEYTLPAISLPWWNTNSGTVEYAVLPARRVRVAAAEPEAAIDTPGLPGLDAGVADPGRTVPDAVQTAKSGETGSAGAAIWQWLTFILAAAWMITLVYIIKNRRTPRPGAPQPRATELNEARKALKQACRDNDPQRAKTALLQWAGARRNGPPVYSLGDLEQHGDENLAEEIRNLSRALYSRDGDPWRGEPLWQAFLQESKTAGTDTTRDRGDLEPLFRL